MLDFDRYVGRVPNGLIDGLRHYSEKGIPTGGFLEAVLSNNLMQSVRRADVDSMASLQAICELVYWELPSSCHGTPEIVKAWIARFSG